MPKDKRFPHFVTTLQPDDEPVPIKYAAKDLPVFENLGGLLIRV